jgi:hypothetical protein
VDRFDEYYDKADEIEEKRKRRSDKNDELFEDEFATEVAPVPMLANQVPDRPKERDAEAYRSEEGASVRTGGQTVGWIGLVLAIASLFIYPVLMGLGAIVLGIIAFVQGSRSLGTWSAVIGGIALLSYYVLVPYYT